MSQVFEKSQIHLAVETGNWSGVLNARMAGVPWIELTNAQGIRALHQAVLLADPLIIQHFLDRDAPVKRYQALDGKTYSPLWAALTRDLDAVGSLLVRAGAECDLGDPFNPKDAHTPPLVAASRRRLPQTTLALLHCGVNLRALSADQRETIFHSWFSALVLGKSAADMVLHSLETTGWYPEGSEAEKLEQRMTATEPVLTDAQRQPMDCLKSAWRKRRSQHLIEAPLRLAPKRERS
jgi:hypothetical protein